eukprot:6489067-Amphidinium_carterae.1
MSNGWASEFTKVADAGKDAQAETAASCNAWGSAFTTLAEEWANSWKNGDQCPMALVDISAAAETSTIAWTAPFISFTQNSADTNGVASAASSSNSWGDTWFKIFDVYAQTYGATTSHGCSDVLTWADIYHHIYDHSVAATLSWATHFESYSGYGFSSKASAVNSWSWSVAFQHAAHAVDVSSGVWSQTCVTAPAAEAGAASDAVAYMVGNFSDKIHLVPDGWVKAFQDCPASTTCTNSASSGSNTWASLVYHTSFAHASAFWASA